MNSKESAPASSRGFWALWITQFQGAFSDNVHKNLVIFIVLAQQMSPRARETLPPLIGALFALPFILFSMTGGWLADRFSKRTVMIGVKFFEIVVMTLALLGFAVNSLALLIVTVFFMGAHSAFFGPSKYGSLPELLQERRLSWGNGVLQLGTYVSIITGTLTAGLLSDAFRGRQIWSGLILVTLAGLGTFVSLGITRLPAADPTKRFRWNIFGDLFDQLRLIRRDRVLTLAVMGNTYFSFLGALLLLNIIIYGKEVLGATDTQIGLLQATIAVGIGIGAFAAGVLSGAKIEYGLVPFGAVGLTIFAAVLGRPHLSMSNVAAVLGAAGFFAGFFIVPVGALLQRRPDRDKKGAVLGAANLLSFVGIFAASGAWYLMKKAGLTAPQIFLTSAILTLMGTVYAIWFLPDTLLRLALWTLTHSVYRVRLLGRENIPEDGGALFVCNRLSFVDALLLQAATDRPLRCIIFNVSNGGPIIRALAKIGRHIPISSQQSPEALRIASNAIRNEEVVVISCDDQNEPGDNLLPAKRIFDQIMINRHVPIVPICLGYMSQRNGWFRCRETLRLNFGKSLPPNSAFAEVCDAVQEVNADAPTQSRSGPALRDLR